jgi:hypothetical protein
MSEINLTPPKSAKGNAQQVLKWKDEKGDEVKGMTATGWARARQLASGKALSEDVVKRMASFARHEKNAKVDPKFTDKPWKDRGYVAWLGWGGTSGIEWAKKKSKEIDRKKENQMNGLNLSKTTMTDIAKKLNAMVIISNKSEDKKESQEDDKKENSKEFTVKVNAKQMPEVFMARHMREGVARYEGEDGDDVILVRNDTIRKMCESMRGVPVFVIHQDVDMENLQQQADGYVSKCFYNENDGWWWCEFVAVSDKAHEAIQKGWLVSNAYGFEEVDVRNEDGTYINVPYNREILNGEFNHLAIVPDPRYEDAVIMTQEEYKQYNSQLRDSLENVK